MLISLYRKPFVLKTFGSFLSFRENTNENITELLEIVAGRTHFVPIRCWSVLLLIKRLSVFCRFVMMS